MTLVLGIGLPELLIIFVLMIALPGLAIYLIYRLIRSATRRGTEDALRAAEARQQDPGANYR